MKTLLLLPFLSLFVLLSGCDIKTGKDAEDFSSHYYAPGYGGYFLESHILIGSLEVLDNRSRTPLAGVRIVGWIFHDGIIRDSFIVHTTDQGIARIETTLYDTQRPFGRVDIRILEPGFSTLYSSISIRKIDTIYDNRGVPTTVYEASDVFYLSPF